MQEAAGIKDFLSQSPMLKSPTICSVCAFSEGERASFFLLCCVKTLKVDVQAFLIIVVKRLHSSESLRRI